MNRARRQFRTQGPFHRPPTRPLGPVTTPSAHRRAAPRSVTQAFSLDALATGPPAPDGKRALLRLGAPTYTKLRRAHLATAPCAIPLTQPDGSTPIG